MRICFLGTGGSWPTKKRNSLSVAVTSGRTNVLLDCGEGTQRQMLFSPVSPMKIDAVLISHLHGDHFLGLPGLLQSMSLNDRKRELHIYGPEGIGDSFKMGMLMCHYTPRFPTVVHSVKPGETFRIGELNVTTGRADHFVPALGYRLFQDVRPGRFDRQAALDLGVPEGKLWSVLQKGDPVTVRTGKGQKVVTPDMVLGPERAGRSLAYSGDTAYSENIVELAGDADVLIHEATFGDRHSQIASEYKHSTAREAASVALEANAGRLFLVHTSPRYSKEDADSLLLEEAMSIFGKTHLPEDLDCFTVSR